MANECNFLCGPGTPLIVPTPSVRERSLSECDGQGTALNVPHDGIVINKKVDAPRASRGGNAERALAFSDLVITPKTISTRFDAAFMASRGGFAEGVNPSGPMAPKFPFKRSLRFCDGYGIYEKIPLEAFQRVCERQNKECFEYAASCMYAGYPSSDTESEGEWVGTRVRSKLKVVDPFSCSPNTKQTRRSHQWQRKALPGANKRPSKGKRRGWHRQDFEAYPESTADVYLIGSGREQEEQSIPRLRVPAPHEHDHVPREPFERTIPASLFEESNSELLREMARQAAADNEHRSAHALLDDENLDGLSEAAQCVERLYRVAMPKHGKRAKSLVVLVIKTFSFIRCVRRFEKEQQTLTSYAEALIGFFTSEIVAAFGSLCSFYRHVKSAFEGEDQPVSTGMVQDLLGSTSLLLKNPNVCRLLRLIGVIIAAGVARFWKFEFKFDRLNKLWEAFVGDATSKYDAVEMVIEFIRWLAALFTSRGSWMQFLFCGVDTELIENVSTAAKILATNGHARIDDQGIRDLISLKRDVDKLAEYFKRAMSDPKARHYSNIYLRPLLGYSQHLQELIRSSKPREQAYSIFFSGPAGQGKSALTNLTVTAIEGHANLCGTRGMSRAEAHAKQLSETCTVNCSSSKYLSGYNGQTFLIFEDMGNSKNSGKSEHSHTDFLIGAVNNNVVMTPQADVESKGTIPYAAKVVIINSNTDDVGAHELSNSPWSIGRRLGMKVTPRLKEESNGIVDIELWEFDISVAKPTPRPPNTTRVSETFTWHKIETCGYVRLMEIILADYDRHVKKQKEFMASINQANVFCPRGQLLSVCPSLCKCTVVDGEQEEVKDEEPVPVEEQTLVSTALPNHLRMIQESRFCSYRRDVDWDDFDTIQSGYDRWVAVCARLYRTCWTCGLWVVYVFPFAQLLSPAIFWISATVLGLNSFAIAYVAHAIHRRSFKGVWLRASLYAAVAVDKITSSVHRNLADRLVPKTLKGKVVRGVVVLSVLGLLLKVWQLFRKEVSTSVWSKAPKGRVEQTPASSGVQTDVMEKKLRSGVRALVCNDGITESKAWGLMVRSSVMIAPKHALTAGASLKVSRQEDGVTTAHTVLLDSNTLFDLGGDLALVVAHSLGTAKNLLAFVPQSIAIGVQRFGVVMGYDPNVHTLVSEPGVRQVTTTKGASFGGVLFATDGTWAPKVGTSGSVVYDLERFVPIGFSLAKAGTGTADPTHGYFQPFTQAVVERIRTLCREHFMENENDAVDLPAVLEQKVISTGRIHDLSHARFEVEFCHDVVGNCPRRTRATTKVGVSELAPFFPDNKALTEMGPPNLTGGWRDFEKERKLMVKGPAVIPRVLLRRAFETRLAELLVTNPVVMGPLNLDEIINGVADNHHIDGMDLTTSSGWPHFGKKSNFMVYDAVDGVSGARPTGLRADQLEIFNGMVARLEAGEKVLVLFNATKKDEVLKTSKVPRTFYAASLMVIMLVRKYFAPVLSALKHSPLEAEIAIGMNCYAEDWTAIWELLAKQGTTKVIAGDYGSFDMTHSADALRFGYQLMIEMARASGQYSEVDMVAMTTLVESLCEAYMSFDGTWFRMVGWLMSGIPITAELNSLLNQMYFRVAWAHTTGRPMSEYKDFVATTTYGDDHVLSVSEKEVSLHSTFNFATVKRCLESFGMIYTNTEKTQDVHDYENLQDVEYLKRRFTPCAGKVYAPLRLSSLDKRIVWTASKAPDRVKQVLCSLAIDCFEHREEGLRYWTNVVERLRGAVIPGAVGFQEGDPEFLAGTPLESMMRLVAEAHIPSPSFWKDHPGGNEGYIGDQDWLALFCSKPEPVVN